MVSNTPKLTSQKIYTNFAHNFYSLMCMSVADICGKQVTLEVVSEEKKNSKEFKAINMTGKFPLLETPEGHLNESVAIAKYLAHEHPTLCGATPLEKAKVDQWCHWALSTMIPNNYTVLKGLFGWAEVEAEDFNNALKTMKEQVRAINTHLTGDYLVGNSLTIADLAIAHALSIPFQTQLDAGFQKGHAKVSAWFTRVMSNASVVKNSGIVKMCGKGIKAATVKAPVKKEAPKKEAKPKNDDGEEEEAPKKKNPLDLLPPSSFNLYDFKTLFVNCKDKAGEGME